MITTFTPLAATAGGALIGLASVLLMAALGRVFGATGILAGVLTPSGARDLDWRLVLLGGMMSAPLLWLAMTGAMPVIDVPVSRNEMVLGGLLVGIGVTFGSGCTSGHGVCGMARLSPRSIVATATFMTFTALTVLVTRHILGA
ncbi:MAG: YeeE/YedE family protein [Rubellimicrobium sp.]|nr:YeeE/YedE family protein [Rubellimicrobium sp.]